MKQLGRFEIKALGRFFYNFHFIVCMFSINVHMALAQTHDSRSTADEGRDTLVEIEQERQQSLENKSPAVPNDKQKLREKGKKAKNKDFPTEDHSYLTAALRYQAGVQGTKVSGHEPDLTEYQPGGEEKKTTIRRPRAPIQGFVDLSMIPKNKNIMSFLSLQIAADDPANIVDRGFVQGFVPKSGENGVGFEVGRNRLRLGGFENETLYATGMPLSTYNEYRLPYRDQRDRRSVDGISLLTKSILGHWDVQIMKDVSDTNYKNSRKSFQFDYFGSASRKNAAFAVDGRYLIGEGSTFNLLPLIQFGSYDDHKSRYLGLGLKLNFEKFTQIFDVAQDKRAYGQSLENFHSDTIQYHLTKVYIFESRYEFGGGVTPFVKLSQYLTTQGINREMLVIDQRGNQSIDSFDDQISEVFSGIHWNLGLIRPFAWIHLQRQKVMDQPRNPYETISVRAQSIEAGFSGEIR